MKYHKVILGGTFDHFHKGHEKLLRTAFAQASVVTIGLTTEQFYQHKLLASEIESYEIREKNLQEYIKQQGYLPQASILKLTDIYGPALSEKQIDAIVVTEDTLGGAKKINRERQKIGFQELEIVLVAFEHADDAKPITSERIRLGEIDRTGVVYKSICSNKKILTLPQSLRKTLRSPIGEVVTDPTKIISLPTPCLISVGDIVTKDLIMLNHQPDISIVDLKTQRHALHIDEKNLLSHLSHVSMTNDPGSINTEFTEIFIHMRNNFVQTTTKQTLIIKGEEDLLTLPVIVLAPLNSIVVYGQQDIGAIVVRVTKEKKEQVLHLLKQFSNRTM